MGEVYLAYAWSYMGHAQLIGIFRTKRQAFFAAKEARDEMIADSEDRSMIGDYRPHGYKRHYWGIARRRIVEDGEDFMLPPYMERVEMLAGDYGQ